MVKVVLKDKSKEVGKEMKHTGCLGTEIKLHNLLKAKGTLPGLAQLGVG